VLPDDEEVVLPDDEEGPPSRVFKVAPLIAKAQFRGL